MGAYKGISAALSNVAEKLKTDRLAAQEMGQKRELLGMQESSRMRELETQSRLKREEDALKPTTESIVDDTGNIIGTRPVGSVFQPRPDSTEALVRALNGTSPAAPGGVNLPKFTPPVAQDRRIKVIDKSGNKFTVPESQLQDALSQGYKRIP